MPESKKPKQGSKASCTARSTGITPQTAPTSAATEFESATTSGAAATPGIASASKTSKRKATTKQTPAVSDTTATTATTTSPTTASIASPLIPVRGWVIETLNTMADRTIKPKKNGKVKVTVAKAMATVVKITTTSAGTTSMTCRTTSNSLRGGFGASTANSSSSSNQVSGITSGDDSDTSSASTVTDSNATEDESNDSRSYNAPTRNGRNNASVTRVRSLPCQQQAQSSNNSSNGGAAVSNTNFPNATAATATTQGHIYPTLATWPVSSPSSFSQTANRRRDTAVQKLVPPVLYTFHPTDPTASGSDVPLYASLPSPPSSPSSSISPSSLLFSNSQHATKKPRFAAAGVNAMTPTPMLTETPTPDSVGHPRAIATVLTPEMRTPTIAKKKAVSTAYIAMQTPTRVITAAENTKAAAMRLQTGLADSMTVQLGNGRAVTTAAGSNSVGVDDYINSGGIGTNSNTHICTNTNTNQTSSSRRSSSSRSNYHTRSGPPTANQLSQEITTYSRTPRLGITPDDIQAVRILLNIRRREEARQAEEEARQIEEEVRQIEEERQRKEKEEEKRRTKEIREKRKRSRDSVNYFDEKSPPSEDPPPSSEDTLTSSVPSSPSTQHSLTSIRGSNSPRQTSQRLPGVQGLRGLAVVTAAVGADQHHPATQIVHSQPPCQYGNHTRHALQHQYPPYLHHPQPLEYQHHYRGPIVHQVPSPHGGSVHPPSASAPSSNNAQQQQQQHYAQSLPPSYHQGYLSTRQYLVSNTPVSTFTNTFNNYLKNRRQSNRTSRNNNNQQYNNSNRINAHFSAPASAGSLPPPSQPSQHCSISSSSSSRLPQVLQQQQQQQQHIQIPNHPTNFPTGVGRHQQWNQHGKRKRLSSSLQDSQDDDDDDGEKSQKRR